MAKLMTHSGGRIVDIQAVKDCPTPKGTETHCPIPHIYLRDLVVKELAAKGFNTVGEEYALKDGGRTKAKGETESVAKVAVMPGAQFFGLLQLESDAFASHPDYQLIAGLRNSHDKSIASGLAIGSRVFVCDNLAFSGEVTFERKHTSGILHDLPNKVRVAIDKIMALKNLQDNRIAKYKERFITDKAAMVAIMRAATARNPIIAANKTVRVWQEWINPQHEAFKPRTVWSLFNGFTQVLKDYTVEDRVGRTQDLHLMMDAAVDLAPKDPQK